MHNLLEYVAIIYLKIKTICLKKIKSAGWGGALSPSIGQSPQQKSSNKLLQYKLILYCRGCKEKRIYRFTYYWFTWVFFNAANGSKAYRPWHHDAGSDSLQVKLTLSFLPHLLIIAVWNLPGLVSELPRTSQKAAAAERLLPGRPPVQDAPVAAGGHPLLTVQQPRAATSTGPARISGQWVSESPFCLPLTFYKLLNRQKSCWPKLCSLFIHLISKFEHHLRLKLLLKIIDTDLSGPTRTLLLESIYRLGGKIVVLERMEGGYESSITMKCVLGLSLILQKSQYHSGGFLVFVFSFSLRGPCWPHSNTLTGPFSLQLIPSRSSLLPVNWPTPPCPYRSSPSAADSLSDNSGLEDKKKCGLILCVCEGGGKGVGRSNPKDKSPFGLIAVRPQRWTSDKTTDCCDCRIIPSLLCFFVLFWRVEKPFRRFLLEPQQV